MKNVKTMPAPLFKLTEKVVLNGLTHEVEILKTKYNEKTSGWEYDISIKTCLSDVRHPKVRRLLGSQALEVSEEALVKISDLFDVG